MEKSKSASKMAMGKIPSHVISEYLKQGSRDILKLPRMLSTTADIMRPSQVPNMAATEVANKVSPRGKLGGTHRLTTNFQLFQN